LPAGGYAAVALGWASSWAAVPVWRWPWRRPTSPSPSSQAFSGRLRQQVDLDTLTAELLAVAEQTMQPTRVSLWLRPPVR